MYFLTDILDQFALADIRTRIATAPYRPGRATAGPDAAKLKHNNQLDPGSAAYAAVNDLVRSRIWSAATVTSMLLPRRISDVIIASYEPGMAFGTHYDNAVMAGAEPLRTDLAFTLFLNEPDDYEGGELVVERSDGEESIKLAAGSGVFYAATNLHRVEPVTRGNRLVAVGWIQSLCRSGEHRSLLFMLDRTMAALESGSPKDAALLLGNIKSNLLRMWSDV
jgi:PKHD-type hydroxylase